MKTKLIEATNGPNNYGKFLVGRFMPDEWARRQALPLEPGMPRFRLLQACGIDTRMIWVCDLQTREGAMFRPGGAAHADLEKHKIWVCVLFEAFLHWLYAQNLEDLDALPDHVDLPDVPFNWAGYRRPGPG